MKIRKHKNNRTFRISFTTRTPARKASTIRYPRTNTFTLADIAELNEGISTQTVRKHVRTATDAGTLRVTGTKPGCGRGRPCFVYEKN